MNQTLHKETGTNEKELNKFIDDFIDLVEKYGFKCAGGFELLDENHFDEGDEDE